MQRWPLWDEMTAVSLGSRRKIWGAAANKLENPDIKWAARKMHFAN
jgi:hypothetical protein